MEFESNDSTINEATKSNPCKIESINVEESKILRSTFVLENVGEVILTLKSDGLSWKLLDSLQNDDQTCLGIKAVPRVSTDIKFSNVYGVEFINYGIIRSSPFHSIGKGFLGYKAQDYEMYRFSVYGAQMSETQPCVWVHTMYTFGHKELHTCQLWVDQINTSLSDEVGRPKNLLVFVHPLSGKANGRRTWETVAPIFCHARIETKVIVTQRAGHAYDVMASIANKELNMYDGVIAVGGDGFFNEILNGFLLSRHKAPYPPSPTDIASSNGCNGDALVQDPDPKVTRTGAACQNEDSPLLSSSVDRSFSNFSTESSSGNIDEEQDFSFSSERLRFGIIPAGSTDAIVMCTTGARDTITSALHIVLGKRVSLDVAQVVRWKETSSSHIEPLVRYAASFAGYGFFGDVITESEKYRWMGPKRYDYAGTKVFLRHRSYEAEVAYIETESDKTNSRVEKGPLLSRIKAAWDRDKCERLVCRVNCRVCRTKSAYLSARSSHTTPYSRPEETKWLKCRGRFLSVGAAIISNRNERAPDGLVADAHLSDGFLHLLLIRDCPRASYLRHLTQLARKGGRPLSFEFVEHHKTPAFTFTSFGKESVWNLDGELFPAHQLSAQVFQGLVNLFASGPEV